MPKTRIQPVMLGTLKNGDHFIHDNTLWEVLQQNPTRERPPDQGKAQCRKVNTPVIIAICRSNYVRPA